MGTRSNIGIENADGSITAVYCHWDGHPEGVGAALVAHHNSEASARAIVALGDLSSLDERLAPNDGEVHSFSKPADGVTTSYGRDRSESGVDARTAVDFAAYQYLGRDCGAEFQYLWRGGKWLCFACKSGAELPIPVPATNA